MPLEPSRYHCLPSSSWVRPHSEPIVLPDVSLTRPPGVQRARNVLNVEYSQLSIVHVSELSSCTTLSMRPKPVPNSSFLSATPSPFVSVYFQTSCAFDSLVRIVLGPY